MLETLNIQLFLVGERLKPVHATALDIFIGTQIPQLDVEKLYCKEGQVKLTGSQLKIRFRISIISTLTIGVGGGAIVIKTLLL